MKICVIPIDNRPVCYNLFKDIAAIDKNIELYLPPKEYLGGLNKIADIESLFGWIENDVPQVDAIIASLDTIAYGGLIPSRRCKESFEQIKARVLNFKSILNRKKAKIFAFSSIMRISNNNINQEEKLYWDKWGKKLFEYSYRYHKDGYNVELDNSIPTEILDDYIATRKRNFEINKLYLSWQHNGLFDTLIFSKDDCAEYGFNVQEAHALEKMGGFTKTGADEIPLTLFARALGEQIRVKVDFLEDEYKNSISNYEDISIEKSVQGQLELAGCKIVNDNPDMTLIVNNFIKKQGEIVMKMPTEQFLGELVLPETPFMIADVRFANGSDNKFVKAFLRKGFQQNFYGYSAWNTSANTLGSLICAMKVKFLAKNYDDKAFRKLQAIRLLDDWAYQANVRQTLNSPVVFSMKPFENVVKKYLNFDFEVEYSYPWNRLFEIEVKINDHN